MTDDIASKVENYTRLGHQCLSSGKLPEAVQNFTHAHDHAQRQTDEFLLRACRFNLGACHVAAGDAVQGLRFMEQAIPPDDVEDDGAENTADLWYNIGIARHATDDISSALPAYERARSSYLQINNETLAVECLGKMAICHHLLGNLREAATSYAEASRTQHVDGIEDATKRALLLSSATNIYSEVGDMEKCAKCLDELLEVCQRIDDKQVQAKIYHDIGLLYINEGLHRSSAECFEQALKCIVEQRKHDRALEATVLQNLGAAYNYMREYERAEYYHRLAADAYGQLNDRRSQSQVFSNLAYAYTQAGRYQDALTAFSHSVQTAKDCNDAKAQALGCEGLAAVCFRLGKFKRAVASYKETLKLITTIYTDDKDVEAAHASRIVEKLADTIQCQIEAELNTTSAAGIQDNKTLPSNRDNSASLSNADNTIGNSLLRSNRSPLTSDADMDRELPRSSSSRRGSNLPRSSSCVAPLSPTGRAKEFVDSIHNPDRARNTTNDRAREMASDIHQETQRQQRRNRSRRGAPRRDLHHSLIAKGLDIEETDPDSDVEDDTSVIDSSDEQSEENAASSFSGDFSTSDTFDSSINKTPERNKQISFKESPNVNRNRGNWDGPSTSNRHSDSDGEETTANSPQEFHTQFGKSVVRADRELFLAQQQQQHQERMQQDRKGAEAPGRDARTSKACTIM